MWFYIEILCNRLKMNRKLMAYERKKVV